MVWALAWVVWAMAWDLAWDPVWDMAALAWAPALAWVPALAWALEREWAPPLQPSPLTPLPHPWALVRDLAWAVAMEWAVVMEWAVATEWAEDMEWEVDMEWAWAMAAWDLAWEWAWTWTICSGPRGADVAASTGRGTLMMTECTALLDLITASRCAWQVIMMVRNPSMWMSGAPSMNTLAMALAWAVQDLAMAWVQDPAMAWVQDLAMAWVVQDQAWVQAWDQDPRWNLWLSQMLKQRS